MRIRFPFLISFIVILLLSSSLGLLPHSALPSTPENVPQHSDKALHFVAFFALTATFYFILDTARRRVLHLTLVVCTLVLSVGSEVAQGLLPNDREFDPWDVLANVLGSLAALALATSYHKRAAERRRRAKFSALSQDDIVDDVELGQAPRVSQTTDELPTRTVEEELENWDENLADEVWDGDGDQDEDEDEATGRETKLTPPTSSAGSEETPVTATATATATVPAATQTGKPSPN
ncbi:hypothetical protein DV738_g5414, partial [Chaetothyriales sp. CBS 135597]